MRVMIVDDQRVVREGLAALLELIDDVDLVAVATNGAEAIDAAQTAEPEVVLMDLRMPGVDGVQATRIILERQPDIEVVVLTTHADDDSIHAALQAGARGYLTKDAGIAEITRAISLAHTGQTTLDPQVQARLVAGLRPSESAIAALSGREKEVLMLIAAGLSNAEIAGRLVVTEATVKTHINRLFAKIAVRDRAQAVRWAYQHGIAEP